MTFSSSPLTVPIPQEKLINLMKQTNFWSLLSKGAERIDLSILDVDGKDFAFRLIDQLLQKQVLDQILTPSAKSVKELRHFYVEAKHHQFLKGFQSIGCGFPLFISKDPGNPFRPIVAPLFIWRMNLVPHASRKDIWFLRRTMDIDPEPNYVLLTHLEENYNVKLVEKYRSIANGGTLNKSVLSQLCYDLMVDLDLGDHRSTAEIYPTPKMEAAIQLSKNGAIHWSGKLAIFQPQLFDDPAQLLPFGREIKMPPVSPYEHHFGLMLSDPFQKKYLNLLLLYH